MPCVVPNCDPKGQCFALHFPESYLLSQRWKQAIELGSGETLPEDVNPLEAEICQQHFCEFDEYGEPVIFWNKSQDGEIRLSSCRLCMKFTLPTQAISDWHDLTLGEHTVNQLLKKVLQIDCDDSESLDCNICQQCLVRLDMLATIYRQMVNDSKVWNKLKGLSKHERRVWDKISTQKKDSLTEEKPTSSDAILLQVEMNKEEAIDDETESAVILQPENEENGIIDLEDSQKFDERTVEELSETHEGGNVSKRKTEQVLEGTAPKKRVKPIKSSEKRKASDHKVVDKPAKKKTKYRKREKLPAQPKMYLRDLNNRKCYLCIVTFDSRDELLDHLLDHSDEDLVCGHCSELFSSLPSYNRHLAKHDPKERPLQCNHCSLRYKDGKGLRNHEIMAHQIDHGILHKVQRNDKVFTCQYCGKVFNMMHKLESHEDKHTGNKPFKCKQCDKAYSSGANLERHCMQMHTSVKPFKCDICASVFRKSTSYEEHRKSCNPEIIREIIENGKASNICRFCSAEFKQHSDLIDHIDQRHSDEEVNFLHCNICRKRFVEKYYYGVHMQKHLQRRQRSKLCRSEGVNKLTCQHCSKTFTDSGNRARHERLHTGEKPHQCDVCGKRFPEAERLRIHNRIHTGEKPFECKSCGKRFADPSTLYRHRKNVCNF